MFCHRHKDRFAKRRCYYCGRRICPKCQHHILHHIFCSHSCHNKYRIKNSAKKTQEYINKNKSRLFKNAQSLVHGIKAEIPKFFKFILPSEVFIPSILTIITLSLVHVYASFQPVSNRDNTVLLFPAEHLTISEDNALTEPAVSVVAEEPEALKVEGESKNIKKRDALQSYNIARGSISRKELSITFDGGREGNDVKEILWILRKRGLKTTIFLTGEFIERYPELVREMAQDGHEIGNHTYSHPHLTTYEKNFKHMTLPDVDREFLHAEVKKSAKLFKEITGEEMAPLWRAPYGEINKEILQWAFEAGYIHISWTVDLKKKESLDTLDWVNDENSSLYLTADEIKEKILNFGREGNGLNGGIVLMHLGTERKSDVVHERLEEIIDTLSSRGYKFVKVSDMLKNSNPHIFAQLNRD